MNQESGGHLARWLWFKVSHYIQIATAAGSPEALTRKSGFSRRLSELDGGAVSWAPVHLRLSSSRATLHLNSPKEANFLTSRACAPDRNHTIPFQKWHPKPVCIILFISSDSLNLPQIQGKRMTPRSKRLGSLAATLEAAYLFGHWIFVKWSKYGSYHYISSLFVSLSNSS